MGWFKGSLFMDTIQPCGLPFLVTNPVNKYIYSKEKLFISNYNKLIVFTISIPRRPVIKM